ncbi:MAG TPA: L-threonylcarbamoyladenylate synthase [Stellaceae bacterium]|nr:L-threonylcarbamoyladenylate synthase [Stellaceae bacterium]
MPARIAPADAASIARAAELLRAGGLVAIPTETVYGLGADATDERAVAAIFAAKGRPRFNPLIVHVAGLAEAAAIAGFDSRARDLAARFWPGPLTLVLPRRRHSGVSLLASAGLDTVAVRVPAHPVAQAVLEAAGRPIAAPSANRSGRISPTEAAHVAAELGDRVALILDGGTCPVGVESTVLDLSGTPPILLRPGGVVLEQLSALVGPITTATAGLATAGLATAGLDTAGLDTAGLATAGPLRSPGLLASHYAPGLPLRLDAHEVQPGEALLAFGRDAPPGGSAMLWLSRSGDLAEAAANLFTMLRRLDRPDFTGIAVMPIPDHGLGRAINDRLRRAAAPRPGRTATAAED